MEKVKLPREVADAIEHCRKQEFSNRVILRLALDERGTSTLRDCLHDFSETNFDTLVSALYIGYEVEMTPEEIVKSIYRKHDGCLEDTLAWDFQQDIIAVLNAYNIKISGVNER